MTLFGALLPILLFPLQRNVINHILDQIAQSKTLIKGGILGQL